MSIGRRSGYCLAFLAALITASCDGAGPVGPDVVDDALLAQVAEQVDGDETVRLPHLGALLQASREAMASQGGNEEALAHFRHARRLANAAGAAREAGEEEEARALHRRSHGQLLGGIVTALGPQVSVDATAGAAAGLKRVRARLADKELPERVTKALSRVGMHVDAGHAALESEKWVVALHHALTAADGIRMLSPRYVAGKRVRQAAGLLRQARDLVANSATEEESQTLRRAHRLLGVAKDELEAKSWRRAVEAATRSARLSAGVIQARTTAG